MKVNNLVVLKGRIANDLEVKYSKNGTKVLMFSVAVDDGTKDNPHTDFIDCQAYDKYAESIKNFFEKGDEIMIGGRVKTYSVNDRGENRKRIIIAVDSFSFGQKKKKEEEKKVEIGRNIVIDPQEIPFY